MTQRVDAASISHSITGYNPDTGMIQVTFVNPYGEGHEDHVRDLRPVLATDENGSVEYDSDATDVVISDLCRGVAEKMWLKRKAEIEQESGVGDSLGELFGVLSPPGQPTE